MINKLQILQPVASEFEQFKEDFSKVLYSEVPLLQSAIKRVLCSNGKHIRPILLLLTAKACGHPTEKTHDAAVIIEILHTTTLIHDDVVDETKQRRGVASLNAIFDNRIAVLTGDYILAGTILRAAETENITMIKIIAKVCHDLSEGELMQLDNAEKHTVNEEDYFKMINKKTATLISACSEIGAITVNASPETIGQCRLFGKYLGYCFQIKDDIFDYYEDLNIGKPTGNDIREGKITLPLLYALRTAPPEESAYYMKIITQQDFTPENVTALIDFAKQQGGIEYAEKQLREYKQKAIEIINRFPESEARNSLLLLADYFAERIN
ncbi:MAG: polyprenyl synthetase family protein [Tannerella sp.]|jgi:octaprenyl-diphosphate synthase|nr:polyprenyl synthetase family protein [Tannerella sp.]